MSTAQTPRVLGAVDHAPPRSGDRGVTDVLLLLMAVIWGINFSVIKVGTSYVAPLAFNGVRIPIAAAAQLLIARGMRLPKVETKRILRLIALGMLGNGLYQVLFILGVVRSSVATAALIVAASPAIIAIIGRMRGNEVLSTLNWVGIVLQILGASSVVLGSSSGRHGEDSPLGAVLIFGAAISWAVYVTSLRTEAKGIHTMQVGGYTTLGGALVLLVVGLPAMLATDWTRTPPALWGAVLYSSLLAMIVAYLFYYRGLRVLGATRTAVYSNLQPLIAAIVAYVVLGEVPTVPQGIGGALVVTGLVLARR